MRNFTHTFISNNLPCVSHCLSTSLETFFAFSFTNALSMGLLYVTYKNHMSSSHAHLFMGTLHIHACLWESLMHLSFCKYHIVGSFFKIIFVGKSCVSSKHTFPFPTLTVKRGAYPIPCGKCIGTTY